MISEGKGYHVHSWVHGRVQEEVLVLGQSCVGNRPTQAAGVHILYEPPVILCVINFDPFCLPESPLYQ